MEKINFLKAFIEDCRYYDPERIEVKTILNHVDLKGKTLLDIGTGIGRLAFPLAKCAKAVVALDKDKRFIPYFMKHKEKNVKFVNRNLESYLKVSRKFDILLIAWPTFDFKLMKLAKKAMHKDSLCIFITCDNSSDWEKIVDKLGTPKNKVYKYDLENKAKFLKRVQKEFNVQEKKKVITNFTYPNEKLAFRVLRNSIKMWFAVRFTPKIEERLKNIIKSHKKDGKIVFVEEIWFYILKNKSVNSVLPVE